MEQNISVVFQTRYILYDSFILIVFGEEGVFTVPYKAL